MNLTNPMFKITIFKKIVFFTLLTFLLIYYLMTCDNFPMPPHEDQDPEFRVKEVPMNIPIYKNPVKSYNFENKKDLNKNPDGNFNLIFENSYTPLFTGIEKNNDSEKMEVGKVYENIGEYLGYSVNVKLERIKENEIAFVYELANLPEKNKIDFKAKAVLNFNEMVWTYFQKYSGSYSSKDITNNYDDSNYDESGAIQNINIPLWTEEFEENLTGSGTFDINGMISGSGEMISKRITKKDDQIIWNYEDSAKLKWKQETDSKILTLYDYKHIEKNSINEDEIAYLGYFSPIYDNYKITKNYYYDGKYKGKYTENIYYEIRYSAPIYEAHNYDWYFDTDFVYIEKDKSPKIVTYKSIQRNYAEFNDDETGTIYYTIRDYYWNETNNAWVLVNTIEESYSLNENYQIAWQTPETGDSYNTPDIPPTSKDSSYDIDEDRYSYCNSGYITIDLSKFPDQNYNSNYANLDLSNKNIYIKITPSSYYNNINEDGSLKELELTTILSSNTSYNTNINITTTEQLCGFVSFQAWIDMNNDGQLNGNLDKDDSTIDNDFITDGYSEVNGNTIIKNSNEWYPYEDNTQKYGTWNSN